MVKKKYVIGIIIFWAILLLGMIFVKQLTLYTGTEVVLKTIPVDPRDLFRGDYVILRYDISNINLDSILTTEDNFKRNDDLYLKLDTSNKYAKGIQVSKKPFDEGLFLKGKVLRSYAKNLSVKYGLESYFVQEGTGKEIEQNISKVEVLIAVDKRGNGIIKSLRYEENAEMQ